MSDGKLSVAGEAQACREAVAEEDDFRSRLARGALPERRGAA